MRKKILFITVAEMFTESLGGSVIRATDIANFLSRDNDIYIVNMSDKDVSKNNYTRKETSNHISIGYSDTGYFAFSNQMYRTAERLLKQQKFDVICAYFGQTGIYGMLLSRKFGIPVVYFEDNVEYQRYLDFAKTDPRRYPLVPYIYMIERMTCSSADLIVAISEDDADVFRKWARNGRLIVIPNGFDSETCHPFYEVRPNDRPTVLFFGYYRHAANLDAVYLVRDRMVEEVAEEIPDVVFQFVGSYPPTDVVHPNIEFTGYVEDLVAYIRQADLVIVPIVRGGGMKTKVVYSLGFGKTILSTPEGAMGIRKKYKNLHIVDIQDFPEKIYHLLKSAPQVDTSDAEMIRQDFSIQSTLPRLESAIDRVIIGGRNGGAYKEISEGMHNE